MSGTGSSHINKDKKGGFTLVELIMSVGILALVGIVMLQLFMGAKDAAVRAEDLDNSVLLTNRLLESVKAERWKEEPLSLYSTYKSSDISNVIEKRAYYDQGWKPVDENDSDVLFEAIIHMKSDDIDNKKTIYDLEINITRIKPYFRSNRLNPLIYSVATRVYIDTPGEVAK